jgi:murein DD-endopeptidase MepM/ murein hydrolase activator NlpD
MILKGKPVNEHFLPPTKGLIINRFNPAQNHFGVDLVTEINQPVLAVMNGTVTFADWTIETGYIIQIQHENNYLSLYKHNAELLNGSGDHVNAGEAIAIVGNSGELTTGPHLHFELWQNGSAP